MMSHGGELETLIKTNHGCENSRRKNTQSTITEASKK